MEYNLVDVYSTTLLAAILAVAVAACAAVATVAASLRKKNRPFAGTAQIAGMLGVTLAAVALSFHYAIAHAPGTETTLSITDFLLEHPAPLFTIFVGIVAAWTARRWVAETGKE